jgi:molybdate transport system substrate-binding protein
MTVRVLSAGAAKGLVSDLQAAFTAKTGAAIDGVFSAVGAIRTKFIAGEPCDVLILTAKQLVELSAQGLLLAGSVVPIGTVRTAVAVPAGHSVPDIMTSAAFAAAMRAASAIYMPDPYNSTAGIHVLSVLQALGLEEEISGKLRAFPNGETAMRTLAEDAQAGTIGSTQTTEIKYTAGLTLVGPLPPEHDLSTLYSAAVSAKATDPATAQMLVSMLTGADSLALRGRSGFE